MRLSKRLILWLSIASIFIVSAVGAAATLQGFQGGTGYSTTTPANVGNCLQVATTSPFLAYSLAPCSSGGSATTTINGFSGPNFIFATTTDTNIGIVITGSGSTLTFTPVWVGTLADGRISSASNWNTAFTDRLKWDGGSTGLVAATGRTSLGLGTISTFNTTDFLSSSTPYVATTTGNWLGTWQSNSPSFFLANSASSSFAWRANNLSDLTSIPSARTNLGLGTLATGNTVPYASTTGVQNTISFPLAYASTTGVQPSASSTINTLLGPWTLVAGTNITLSSSSYPSTLTINSTGGGGSGIASTTPFSVGYIPQATTTNSLTNSNLFQNASSVGVGTTTPSALLHVNGTLQVEATTTSRGNLVIDTGAAATSTLSIGQTGNQGCIESRDQNNGAWSHAWFLSGIMYVDSGQCQ